MFPYFWTPIGAKRCGIIGRQNCVMDPKVKIQNQSDGLYRQKSCLHTYLWHIDFRLGRCFHECTAINKTRLMFRHHMYNVKSTYKRGCPQRWTNKITNCIPIPASKTKGYDLNLFLYSTQSQTLKKTKAYFPARFALPVQLRVVEHHANPPPT